MLVEDRTLSARGDASRERAVLLVRVGQRQFGLPLGVVERVLPMAAVVALPDAGQGLVGMLNLHGEIMPVVDPRARLGLPTPSVHVGHRMVLVRGTKPFLLWVDDVDEVVSLGPDDVTGVPAQQASPAVPRVFRLGTDIVPLLAPTALEPRAALR
jgi:chemotaxis signal transduction protein